MKKRKTTRAQGTREKILSTAVDLFRRKGFEKTTMREIADKAGVALGAAYYYFRTKESMVLALYERFSGELDGHLDEVRKLPTLEERLAAFTDRLFALAAPYRAMFGVIAQAVFDPRSPLSPFSAETSATRRASIARFEKLAEGVVPELPEPARSRIPQLLWLWHLGLLALWIYDESPEQRQTRDTRAAMLPLLKGGTELIGMPMIAGPLEPLLARLDRLC